MSNQDISVFCADIGSVAKHNFGWYGDGPSGISGGSEPGELAAAVARVLGQMGSVALGFECPLFVPITDDPKGLTRARHGEGSRPWSAGAGAGALATGLTEVVWILRELRKLAPEVSAYLQWEPFCKSSPALFIWEAFVSGSGKGVSHENDAELAVTAFRSALPHPETANTITAPTVHSLAGAALLRTGWSSDIGLLQVPTIVIKA